MADDGVAAAVVGNNLGGPTWSPRNVFVKASAGLATALASYVMNHSVNHCVTQLMATPTGGAPYRAMYALMRRVFWGFCECGCMLFA